MHTIEQIINRKRQLEITIIAESCFETAATHTLDGEGCKQGDSGSHQTRNLTGSQDHQAMTDRFWSCNEIKLIKKFDNAWNGRWNKKRGKHKTHWIDIIKQSTAMNKTELKETVKKGKNGKSWSIKCPKVIHD